MANEFTFFKRLVDSKILGIHTAFLGKVTQIAGDTAMVKPLTMYRTKDGAAMEQSEVCAVVPQSVKTEERTITYRVSEYADESTTVLVPVPLKTGDLVFVGVCERDITAARQGILEEPGSRRHHDMNDGVILRVL